jgi:hypothetical protein
MAQTPDHRPGQISYRDLAVIIADTGSAASTSTGAITYANALYQLTDGLGSYNPRTVYQQTHTALLDIIHFLDDGPAINGAYKTVSYVSGTPFVSSVVWWTSNAQTTRIVDRTITYPASSYLVPTNDVWRIYNVAGALAHTVTDTIVYSGINEIARSRVYS